jgi:hypothetical protein
MQVYHEEYDVWGFVLAKEGYLYHFIPSMSV